MKATNGSSTFNLRRHLTLRHQIDTGINLSSLKSKKGSESRTTVSPEDSVNIDRLLLNCVIRGGLPYNHFSHPWFRELFDAMLPGYRPPDRRALAKQVKHCYRAYIVELKSLLPKDRPIAFTTDVWKSPRRYVFICLTAHVFNDEMKPVSLVSPFNRSQDEQKYQRIH